MDRRGAPERTFVPYGGTSIRIIVRVRKYRIQIKEPTSFLKWYNYIMWDATEYRTGGSPVVENSENLKESKAPQKRKHGNMNHSTTFTEFPSKFFVRQATIQKKSLWRQQTSLFSPGTQRFLMEDCKWIYGVEDILYGKASCWNY